MSDTADRPPAPRRPFRRMQELRKISRDYPFICPVDYLPHHGSPPGHDPNQDPGFIAGHRRDDGGPFSAERQAMVALVEEPL